MKKNASVEKSVWWTHDRKDALKGYVLILPAILLLTVFTIYPIFYLIDSSLRDGSLLSKKRGFVGLENFIMLFKSVDFHTTLKNTFIYSIGLVANPDGTCNTLCCMGQWKSAEAFEQRNACCCVYTTYYFSDFSIHRISLDYGSSDRSC